MILHHHPSKTFESEPMKSMTKNESFSCFVASSAMQVHIWIWHQRTCGLGLPTCHMSSAFIGHTSDWTCCPISTIDMKYPMDVRERVMCIFMYFCTFSIVFNPTSNEKGWGFFGGPSKLQFWHLLVRNWVFLPKRTWEQHESFVDGWSGLQSQSAPFWCSTSCWIIVLCTALGCFRDRRRR